MSRTFVYSDPHFNHERVLIYEKRPFQSTEQMNNQLIKNFNKTVKKGDTTYFLGDIAFHMTKDEITKLIQKLNGKKILIQGNHDRHKSTTWWREVGFEEVHKFPIMVEWRFWLSHEPIPMHKDLPYINIHGHTHSRNLPTTNLHINVSVEQTNYRPILLEEITNRFPK